MPEVSSAEMAVAVKRQKTSAVIEMRINNLPGVKVH